MLKISGIKKNYGRVSVLDNISFDNFSITGNYNGPDYFINKNGEEDDADEIKSIFLNGNNNTITSSN